MKLYEIDAALENCAIFDETTGEVIELDYDAIRELVMERDAKLENIACWIKSLNAEAEAVKTEKLKLQKRQQTLETRADGLKQFLQAELAGEKIKTGRVSVSYHTTRNVVDIKDAEMVPADFMVVRKIEPDKTALKNAILAGEIIDGVQLVDKVSIVIK